MQVVSRAASAPPLSRPTESSFGAPVSEIPSPLKIMLERIATSTRLSFSQKRSFADALKHAFERGDGKLIAKIMMLVALAEAEVESGRYGQHRVNDILLSGQTDNGSGGAGLPRLVSGEERLRQLLFA